TPTRINMEIVLNIFETFSVVSGRNFANAIPAINGNKSIKTMLTNKSMKLISNFSTCNESDGTNDDQKKKLKGVIRKQKTEVNADNVTDKARLPFASIEKKFEAFPPGHEATRIIPNAISVGGFMT
ncbi:MAG: hypothetical protein ABJA70_11835, partial [Chryseolinea sp.]